MNMQEIEVKSMLNKYIEDYIPDKCKKCPYFSLGFNAYCDKTGGKILLFGSCIDYPEKVITKTHSRKKKMSKRERDAKYKKHLKELEKYTYCVSMYVDKKYIKGYGYQPIENPYYKRLYISNHAIGATVFTKRKCNKR